MGATSGKDAELPLGPKRENSHFIAWHEESVEGVVAGWSAGNDELAQFTRDATAEQRVCRESFHG